MTTSWAQLAGHRPGKQVLVTGLVLLVLLARCPAYWSGGEFVAEDGWVFFADAWNHGFPGSLLLPYAGYFHGLSRLIAELWSGLPLTGQPYAYAATGLVLNAAILGAFYHPVFRRIMAPDLGRLIVVGFLALAPHSENLGLILGLHWYLAFGLTLLLLAPVPAGRPARVAVMTLIFLCVWSSPSAFALAPFALFTGLRSRNPAERLQLAIFGGMLLVVGLLIGFMRIEDAERTGIFQWTDMAVALDRLILRGWIGVGLLGPVAAGYLARQVPLLLDLFGLGALASLLALLWRHRAEQTIRQAALLLGTALLMLLLSLSRTAYVAEMARLALPRHGRYLTAPTLLLYVGLGVVICQAGAGLRRRPLAASLGVAGALLIFSVPGAVHWSRPAVWFHLRDVLPAIAELRAQFARDGRPASLYVPSDVPYWGPVLEVGGGLVIPPDAGLAGAVGAQPDGTGHFDSWLGRFREAGQGRWIEHEMWGRLEFAGLEKGRVFFHDSAGRLLFTSPLLYPRLWVLDGTEWTLVQPPR